MKELLRKRSDIFTFSIIFLIDNNLLRKNEINDLFDILINKTSLEKKLKIL
jgi:hypothetical protein